MDETLMRLEREWNIFDFEEVLPPIERGPKKHYRPKDPIGEMVADELVRHPKKRASTTRVR